MREQTDAEHEIYEKYMDYIRDILKHSVYQCSCGLRLYGEPASYHVIMLKHTQKRERFVWEIQNENLQAQG